MNTPDASTIFSLISAWVSKHHVLISFMAVGGAIIANQFVRAEDYNKFKLETTAALVKKYEKDERQDAMIELIQVREDIEDYKRFPDYQSQDHIMDRIRRLERRQAVLEEKI